jgi:hypothetical protein
MSGRHSFGDDHAGDGRDLPERGPAQEVIGEMAWLLRDTRGSMLLGGSVLSGLAAGIGVETAFSPSVLRPGLAGLACGVALIALVGCWIRAGVLLLLAGRPVLDQLNDHRWRSGAPVDPRVRWLSLPPIEDSEAEWNWARVNLLLGAARIRRERSHLGDTWTFITVAVFLVWTALVFLVLSGRRLVSPSSLSTASGWLIVSGSAGCIPLAGT